MTTIYLVRHCQSIANAKRLYNCSIDMDDGLSENGKKHAETVGKFFNGKKIAKIYSSPFLRTRQTAEAIASSAKCEIELNESFGELNCGDWNGKSEMEIIREFPEAWKGWHYDPQNNPIPGGESLLELQARVLPEFERIVQKGGGDIVIVTHYAVINVILCSLISSIANFRSFDTRNGTIAEIRMENVPRLRMFSA